jgi:hypothetical protein
MKGFSSFVLLLALTSSNVAAQHASPAVPVSELETSMREVADLYKWPALGNRDHVAGPEEVRIWLGGGATWPGMVLRLVDTARESGTGQLAMWWRKGNFGNAMRQSIEHEGDRGCSRILSGPTVEGCVPADPDHQEVDWSALRASGLGGRLRSALLASPETSPAASDSAALVVEYWTGTRSIRVVSTTQHPVDAVAVPAMCLFMKAMLAGRALEYPENPECQ